jgi:predicted RNase H-like nuclease
MTPELQTRIHEAAPELAFTTLTGVPMQYNKKTREGRKERLQALGKVLAEIAQTLKRDGAQFKRSAVALDDLLDAYVLAWTALRIHCREANRLPAAPPIDAEGLRMEIWS